MQARAYRILLFWLVAAAASAFAKPRCVWREMAPEHKPQAADISRHPPGEPLLGIPAGKDEQRRTGMLVRTDKGRVIFVVSRFMAAAGHKGMDYLVREELKAHLGDGEKIQDYLWSGEFLMKRNPNDPTKPRIVEINPTSGFLTEILAEQSIDPSKNNPQALKDYLNQYAPGLVAHDVNLVKFDSQNPHLDSFMSKWAVARQAEYQKELAAWKAGGEQGKRPEKPNFRHDIGGPLGATRNTLNVFILATGLPEGPLKKKALDEGMEKIKSNGKAVANWARLLHDDGVHVVDNPGTAKEIDHIQIVETGLASLVDTEQLPRGMTMKQLENSLGKVAKYYQQLGLMGDGPNAATDPTQRSLLPANVEIFQLTGPR